MPTITIDDAVHAKIKELAAKLERTEEEALAYVLESGLEYNLWYADKVQEGLDSLDRGEYVTREEMERRIQCKYESLKERRMTSKV
jgi:predicted transcriptional regulator